MLQLPYGLRGQQLVHISEAEPGLACGCVCPSCGHPLVARKGSKLIHHFAHARDAECARAVETALHLAAKHALEAAGQIKIPAVIVGFDSYKNPWPLQDEMMVSFDEVRLEQRLGDIVPDILVYAKGRPLLIEVAVTHAVDEIKLQKIRRLGISALEITLDNFVRNPTPDELREEVVFATRTKQWLYNAREEAVRALAQRHAEPKRHRLRDGVLCVDDCPIDKRGTHGSSYARVQEDCLYCTYCLDAGLSPARGRVWCAGRQRLEHYHELVAVTQRA